MNDWEKVWREMTRSQEYDAANTNSEKDVILERVSSEWCAKWYNELI
jgi:hypothetical protein